MKACAFETFVVVVDCADMERLERYYANIFSGVVQVGISLIEVIECFFCFIIFVNAVFCLP